MIGQDAVIMAVLLLAAAGFGLWVEPRAVRRRLVKRYNLAPGQTWLNGRGVRYRIDAVTLERVEGHMHFETGRIPYNIALDDWEGVMAADGLHLEE